MGPPTASPPATRLSSPDSAFDLASPVWRRLIGDDANHAARGIGTERARLWAAKHFDLLHVE